MNQFKTVLILLLSSVLSFYSCGDDAGNAAKQEARESLEVSNPSTSTTAAPSAPATPEPAQNAAGVWHYTCEKGCAGGAGKAGVCATCGGNLAHNTAYHAGANNATATPPTNTSTAPTMPEPAQNAAGVWHYTCSKGCAGGAGTAGTCTGCGGDLAHNSAYHQ